MKITIVYDNEVFEKNKDLRSDWGFSCFIEDVKENILFDTGSKAEILLHNMKILDVKPESIDKIVISHEHYDHNGGLKIIQRLAEPVEIYRFLQSNLNQINKTFIIDKPQKITENIYSTGRLKAIPVDEQSLILNAKSGFFVLTGCSHPSVKEILKQAKHFGNIRGIIGGFHGFSDFKLLENFNLICPCHCTKYKKEITSLYPNNTTLCGVGKILEI